MSTEKNAQGECCEVKFLGGQIEDYNLGDSLSGNFKELLWRGKGGGLYICDLGGGGDMCNKHTFWQKVTAGHKKVSARQEEQMSPLIILVLF